VRRLAAEGEGGGIGRPARRREARDWRGTIVGCEEEEGAGRALKDEDVEEDARVGGFVGLVLSRLSTPEHEDGERARPDAAEELGSEEVGGKDGMWAMPGVWRIVEVEVRSEEAEEKEETSRVRQEGPFPSSPSFGGERAVGPRSRGGGAEELSTKAGGEFSWS
jgi:hypothetical protein